MDYSQNDQREMVENADVVSRSRIAVKRVDRNLTIQRHVIDLSIARDQSSAKKLGFEFRSIYVESSNDPANIIYFKPTTNEEQQSYVKLSPKDSWTVSDAIPDGFLFWPAQPGKTMELVIFVDAEFRSGTIQSLNAGGVSISEGASISAPIEVTLAVATAAIIAPQDFTRKVSVIQNNTGAPMWIAGSNTVTGTSPTKGIEVAAGATIYHRNTGALYGFSTAGGKINRIDEV